MTQILLDRVSIFGDQLSFLIPHEWVESEEETDHYLYHAPNADSGWFRVSLLTLKGPGKASRDRLKELMEQRARKENGRVHELGANIVLAWEKGSKEKGTAVWNYWWAVGHSYGPDLGQEALFSYTILQERSGRPETREIVARLASLVADARFAEPKIV